MEPFGSIPVIICFVIFFLFAIEHFRNTRNSVFQGIYLRAMAIFPVVSALIYAGGVNHQTTVWCMFAVSFIEGYVFVLFFGMCALWGWCNGDVHAALLRSNATRTRYYFWGKHYGPEYTCGKSCFRSLLIQSLAMMIIKPLVSMFEALYATYFGKLSFLARFFGTGVVILIGIIISLMSLIRLFLALSGRKIGEQEAGTNLIEGLSFMKKFAIVKVLLWCIVINGWLFEPLVNSGTLPAPAWMCVDLDLHNPVEEKDCDARLFAFIFNCQSIIFTIFSGYLFRPKDLDTLPDITAYCGSSKPNACRSFYRIFLIWDVAILSGRAPSTATVAVVDLESNSVEDITVKVEKPEAPQLPEV